MELRVLRYFLAVAREQNITAAADFLHISQPTLSRQLMDLEEELGKKLMIRGKRQITLTEEGRLLRKRADELVALADKTEAEIAASDQSIRGDIYIGGGETDAMRYIAKTARRIRTLYPDIHYHIVSGDKEDISEKLDKGLFDFGLFVEPADITKYEFLRLPATDRWGVLMRRDSPLAAKESIQPEDLWPLPLILSRQTAKDKKLTHWLKKDLDQLNIVATYNLVYNASLMVDEGLGYALTLDKLIHTADEKNSLCFRPLQAGFDVHLDLVWKKYQVFSKAANLFLQEIKRDFDEAAL